MNKQKFKKIPSLSSSNAEQNFINAAEGNLELNKVIKSDDENVAFLIRVPKELKMRLKKYSYDYEIKMNQVCIEAIQKFLINKKY